MKIITKLNDLSLKGCVHAMHVLPRVAVVGITAAVIAGTVYADGVNHLAGLKSDVSATFGAGSDTQYFILLAEGLAGAYAYMKTKNVAMLAGVPLLMAFTHWALK